MCAKSATDPDCKISKIVTRAFITLLSQLRNSTATSESTPCCDKGTPTSTSASHMKHGPDLPHQRGLNQLP